MYAVIMAGGSGTRFWPLSRETMPKQLLKIGGEDTLIRETVSRVLPLVRMEDIFIVTNQGLADSIGNQLSTKFNRSWDGNVILEPEAKNTAPALGLAALHLERLDPEAVMIVLAADHSIRKTDEFLNVLRKAGEAALHCYLVTLGIKPDRPETGYGYIKSGEKCKEAGIDGVCKVEAFVEKPDVDTAKGYLKKGGYYWNSGMFVWKVSALLGEIAKCHPALHQGLEEIRMSIGTEKEAEVIKAVFKELDPISIDYAVMEKTNRAAVIPADIGWSDVGSWTALDEVSDRDAAGNVITGNVIDIGSRDSIIYAEKRLVATIGLKNAVVVDTPDATLVCSKERAQDVKKIVYELKKRKAEEHLTHRTVHRPWGSYTILVNGDREYDVHPNESTYIPMSTKHRLENRGRIPLQIIEVQNGEYLEEDDIVRFDDDYNRHEKSIRGHLPPLSK
jgi:mannose-1-phosphate guanylyltransferase/mannose-6-phosphate isomerase